MNLQLEIISPEGILFSGEVKEIILPTPCGELTILPKHMPLMCPLETGLLQVKTEKKTFEYTIGKGFFSIWKNSATLLIEDVLLGGKNSEEKALEAKRNAKIIIPRL